MFSLSYFEINAIRTAEWFGKIHPCFAGEETIILGIPCHIPDWGPLYKVYILNGNGRLSTIEIHENDAEKLMTWKPICNNCGL